MRIILILIFIFSYKEFRFINYTYLISKKETEITNNLKLGNYLEQIIKISKINKILSIFPKINKIGDYNFDNKLIT